MFSSSLTEDVRYLTEDINIVSDKIDDPVLCQKIEQYACAPAEIKEIYQRDAGMSAAELRRHRLMAPAVNEGLDLLVIILRSPDPPTLSRPQFQRVFKAARSYKEYKASQADLEDSDDDMGPEDEDAWLFEDLALLLKLWLRKREKEALVALIFEVSPNALSRIPSDECRESPRNCSRTSSQSSTLPWLRFTKPQASPTP